MAITDLTGTTWKLNSTLSTYPGGTYTEKNYALNISTADEMQTMPGTYTDTFVMASIGYSGGSERNEVVFSPSTSGFPYAMIAIGNDTKTLPDTWRSKYDGFFTINGGTDATNADLIAWFEANATIKPPDVVVSYSGSEIASTSESATKRLLTSGKYCEDDIIVTYTKPTPTLQKKTATPSLTSQTITADQDYDGLSRVTIEAMPSGTAGTPTATKGTVSNHAVSVTPSVTNTTGYITGGTKTGTAVSVSASELVSGTLTISSGGTKDVTNYASASVATGSALTPETSITANPSISVSSGGLITATASALESVTPIVSAGYVTEGTAGTVTVSGSSAQQLTTQAAQTITPTTTNQTIASGKYLTGAQTILGDANLLPENIKKDVSIFGTVGTLEGGGGGGTLCIFTVAPYTNTSVNVNRHSVAPMVAYYGTDIVPGATITFYTYSDYILRSVTGLDSGSTIPFTTVTRGTYTFTMPSESVECDLLYDD